MFPDWFLYTLIGLNIILIGFGCYHEQTSMIALATMNIALISTAWLARKE